MRALAVPLLVLCVGALAGCRVYDPALASSLDAGRDAALDAGAPADALADGGASRDTGPADAPVDAGPSCTPSQPPPRPAATDGAGPELVFALRDLLLDQGSSRWQGVAWDLDDECTSVGAPGLACSPPTGDPPPSDGEDGVDNALGRDILALAVAREPDLERDAHRDMAEGRAAIVVRIAGWNGADDDPRVDAHIAQSVRADNPAAMSSTPLWDGADRWFVSQSDYADGDPGRPLIRDDVAHVAGRVLVMRIPEGRAIYFPWSGNVMRLAITDGTLTARISDDAMALEDVRITGRWALTELQEALTGAGVCPGDIARTFVDMALMRTADVRSDPRTDGSGAPCDALSFGLGLRGVRATFGGVEAVPVGPPPCP